MLQPGDEILTTPLTCTATNWPILANDFKIKWVDVDPRTLNMDLDDLILALKTTLDNFEEIEPSGSYEEHA